MRVTPDVLGEVNIEHRLTDRIGLITPRTPPPIHIGRSRIR